MRELNKSQREALVDIASGLQQKEIAEKYGVTRSAIDIRLSEARRKLQSKTTAHAVARAIKWGIIKPSEIAIICFLCLGGVDDDAMRTNRTQPRPPTVRVRRREDLV